jgi:WXG100 family type VII secretion target
VQGRLEARVEGKKKMQGFRVTPEQLSHLSSRVSGSAGQIDRELRSLDGTLAPLGSDWAGTAQQRFTELYRQWQDGARQLHQALDGISQLLGQAGSHYADAERAIAASFGRM